MQPQFTLAHDSSMNWCGKCAKCAFVFLVFAPFLDREKLITLFGGNLFADPSLDPTYRALLGIQGHKPFDCVGEIRECRQAVKMARETGAWPEVDKYQFPSFDYDYKALQSHSMPSEYFDMLRTISKRSGE